MEGSWSLEIMCSCELLVFTVIKLFPSLIENLLSFFLLIENTEQLLSGTSIF